MSSILYDSTELVAATYIPRYVQHDSAPDRKINSVKLARQDGEVIIDDNFGVKFIDIKGVLTGSSQANLEANIDSFKELISRKDKNLDIVYSSGTRRYVCRSISHEINRDHFHLLHAPYNVRFLVAKGYGTDTSETTALNVSGIVASPENRTITFAGSYNPKPRHKITLTTRGNADVVRIMHVTTGDYIDVDLDGFINGDYLEIDEENQTVKKNGTTNLNYRGKFPSVIIGDNSMRLIVYGAGSELDISQADVTGSNDGVFYDNAVYIPNQAQSFVPIQSGKLHKINCKVGKDGSPTGKMQWHIRYDDNNKPMAGAAGRVSDEEFEIAAASVPGTPAFTDAAKASGTSPFLIKGRRYWLCLNGAVITGSNNTNFYRWAYTTAPASYTDGKAMTQEGSAADWVDGASNAQTGNVVGQFDTTFKIYRGDGGAASYSIVWQCYYTKKYL